MRKNKFQEEGRGMPMYLRQDRVRGESTDPLFEGWLEIYSYQFESFKGGFHDIPDLRRQQHRAGS
jgi:hypothetical protein